MGWVLIKISSDFLRKCPDHIDVTKIVSFLGATGMNVLICQTFQ